MLKLLEAKNIGFQHQETQILDHVSLSIHEQEMVTIVGPNGAGKSTLLKILLGIEKATSGQIHRQPNLKIGYVPQKFNIDSTLPLRVIDFLKLSPFFASSQCLAIDSLLHKQLCKLSGGELQQVLLTRALFHQPKLLVLDEPTQGMDIQAQAHFLKTINSLKQKMAVLLVSHDLIFVSTSSTRVICLNQHICCQGTPTEIQQDPSFQSLFGHSVGFYHHNHDCDHDHA